MLEKSNIQEVSLSGESFQLGIDWGVEPSETIFSTVFYGEDGVIQFVIQQTENEKCQLSRHALVRKLKRP